MIRRFVSPTLAVAMATLLALPAFAQDKGEAPKLTPEQQAEMDAYQKAGTPGPQHEKLATLVGKYSIKSKNWFEPDAKPIEDTGTATRTMQLDGRVLVEDVQCTMMGQPMSGHGMTGYDNVSGKHWSIWTDSNSTGIMVTQGSCDANLACTFTGTWNDPITKGPKKARMVSRRPSPTTELWEMYGPDKKGKEYKMMEMIYTKM